MDEGKLVAQLVAMTAAMEEMRQSLKQNQEEMAILRNSVENIDTKTTVMADTSESLASFIPFVAKLEKLCYYVNPMNFFRALPSSDYSVKRTLEP